MRVVRFTRYVIRRLKRNGLNELASPLEAAFLEHLLLGRAWEDCEFPYQDALADRDALDDEGDELVRDLHHALGSRSRTARKEPPYTAVFPDGLGYYTRSPITEQEARRGEILSRADTNLPPDDLARTFLTPIKANLETWSAAKKLADGAMLAQDVAREKLQASRTRLDGLLTSTWGKLTDQLGSKARADRYFPKEG